MEDPLLKFHEGRMKEMGFPDWIKEIKCPLCKKQIPLRAIRSIQLCLNTRNFGEVAVEVLCDDCRNMDTVYFRTKMDHVADFVACLKGSYSMPPDPILEEDMYKMNYNNILEIMVGNTKKETKNDDI